MSDVSANMEVKEEPNNSTVTETSLDSELVFKTPPVEEFEVCTDVNQITLVVFRGKPTMCSSNSWTCNVSKTITLPQHPREIAHLEFSLNYIRKEDRQTNNCENQKYSIKYYFALTFNNNLHKVSTDYVYEIDFYIYAHENHLSSHAQLFSQKKVRESEKIVISETFVNVCQYSKPEFVNKLLSTTEARHMCCSIRRYNMKIAEQINKQSRGYVNVGAMLLEKGFYSDVKLIAGDKTFLAHKRVLSAASSIFKIIFSRDSSKDQKNSLIIDDCDPQAVEGLLSFVYTGKTALLDKIPVEIFELAHKYKIDGLKTQCIEALCFTLNSQNIVKILCTVSTYGLKDLKKKLSKLIEIHEVDLVKDEMFQKYLCEDLDLENVIDTLKLCDKYQEYLSEVTLETFKFMKNHHELIMNNENFFELFDTNMSIIKKWYHFAFNKE